MYRFSCSTIVHILYCMYIGTCRCHYYFDVSSCVDIDCRYLRIEILPFLLIHPLIAIAQKDLFKYKYAIDFFNYCGKVYDSQQLILGTNVSQREPLKLPTKYSFNRRCRLLYVVLGKVDKNSNEDRQVGNRIPAARHCRVPVAGYSPRNRYL